MTDIEVFALVRAELAKARTRYPWWPQDLVQACAIANEESGEVVKAVNNRYWQHGPETIEDIRKEAVQAIAMWVRFLVETPDVDEVTMAHNLALQGKGEGFEEFEAFWPAVPDMQGGIDRFAQYPVSGEPDKLIDDKRATC